MATAYARQGETLDALCWREMGATDGVVEAVLELNPGLAALGVTLPHGTAVQLPERSTITAPTASTINLWD